MPKKKFEGTGTTKDIDLPGTLKKSDMAISDLSLNVPDSTVVFKMILLQLHTGVKGLRVNFYLLGFI